MESAPLYAPAKVAWAKEWLPALGDILLERQPTLRAGDRPGGGRRSWPVDRAKRSQRYEAPGLVTGLKGPEPPVP